MQDIIDLERYPINRPKSESFKELVVRCQAELKRDGMFNLVDFMHDTTCAKIARELEPRFETEAFRHARTHNIYFRNDIAGLAPDHPALQTVETVNHTLCGDQLTGTALWRIYNYQPFIDFVAKVMNKPALFQMADPLACLNAMAYKHGEGLNWHFDRSEFTITLLLQKPEHGGAFQYRSDLRGAGNPNYDGVAKMLEGKDPKMKELSVRPGTLNIFKGVNTAHRVTKVQGAKSRIIAVLGYYESPDVQFTSEERLGFYGRTI